MICFYHDDLDGRCSAAILYKHIKDSSKDGPLDGSFIPRNYSTPLPEATTINFNEEIFFLDFIEPPSILAAIVELTPNITWIDHHVTRADWYPWFSGKRLPERAACELTWEHFFPSLPLPEAVKLLGDYDAWAFKYKDDTSKFQEVSKLYDTSPQSSVWDRWLNPDYKLVEELSLGKVCLDHRTALYKELCSQYAYRVILKDVPYAKCIACNIGAASARLFDSLDEDFDIKILYAFNGKDYIVSLYSDRVNVGDIAKKFNGGGHAQAAGFSTKELPFRAIP